MEIEDQIRRFQIIQPLRHQDLHAAWEDFRHEVAIVSITNQIYISISIYSYILKKRLMLHI